MLVKDIRTRHPLRSIGGADLITLDPLMIVTVSEGHSESFIYKTCLIK